MVSQCPLYPRKRTPEVDVAEIDRDLFAVSGLWTELMYLGHIAILKPSWRMVHGW
jgi:hypothetical protein